MDLGSYFWGTIFAITIFYLLWKKKRRWLIGFMILSSITAWIDPYMTQDTLQGQFVYEIGSYVVAIIGTYVLLGRTPKTDG